MDLGAVLDGRGDYVTFSDEGFSAAREFTISFWFSRRTECTKPGRYEFLYSEAKDDSLPFWRTAETAVEVYLKCDDGSGGGGGGSGGGNRGNRNSDETAGDMLRTWVSDDCGSRAVFDIAMEETLKDGPIDSQWVHYLLSVRSGRIDAYIDGEHVSHDAVKFDNRYNDPATNIAYPDPTALGGALCGFGDITSRGAVSGWSAAGIETTEDLGSTMSGAHILTWQALALGSVKVTSWAGTTCAGAAWTDSQAACLDSAGTCAGADPDISGTTTRAACEGATTTAGTFTSTATYAASNTAQNKAACETQGCEYTAPEDGSCDASRSCNPGVQIAIGCSHPGQQSSTLSGDIIRVVVTSDDCKVLHFDVPLSAPARGA